MTFTVFTADGRSSMFEGQSSSTFIVQWQAAVRDPEKQWPFAYLSEEGRQTEVIHFNPTQITAVAVGM